MCVLVWAVMQEEPGVRPGKERSAAVLRRGSGAECEHLKWDKRGRRRSGRLCTSCREVLGMFRADLGERSLHRDVGAVAGKYWLTMAENVVSIR